MASSSLLALSRRGKAADIKAQWLQFNSNSNYDVHSSQNIEKPKARYFSVCYTAPTTGWKKAVSGCRAHVRAVGDTADDMVVVSIDLVYTCGAGHAKRKRNYLTRDLSDISDVIGAYQPTTKKEGNAKQFMKMAKVATGITIKSGQATLAVRSRSNDTLEAQIGQCFWLPSLFLAYEEMDPGGTFILEDKPCPWNHQLRQFDRAHVCLSIAKHFWKKAKIKLIMCDGTFTRVMAFRHVLLIIVTFDGNNQLVILAFAIVDVENSTNWVWMKERLDEDFPDYNVWMSDADKGITSNAFSHSVSQSDEPFVLSRCARHLAANCYEACKGECSTRMNDTNKDLIIDLAKSRTEAVHQLRLEAIRKAQYRWAEWLDSKKDEFVAASFLQRGYCGYGKVTSNGVENTNGALSDARNLPIVCLCETIIKYQRESYKERKDQAIQWLAKQRTVTEYLEAEDIKMGDTASRRDVEITHSEHPVHTARVATDTFSTITAFVEVTVNVDLHIVRPPACTMKKPVCFAPMSRLH